VRTTNDGRRRECSARRLPPSVETLFFTLRDSYGLQHCRPVCSVRSDIRSESRCLPTAPAFDAPVRGIPVGISHRSTVWHRNTRMAWLPNGEKISKIFLFVLTQHTNVTDGHRMPAIAALMHSIARQKSVNWFLRSIDSDSKKKLQMASRKNRYLRFVLG